MTKFRRQLMTFQSVLMACGVVAFGAIAAALEPGRSQTEPPAGKGLTALNLPEFPSWPKDTKPDAVVVISGQTYGYLQPCGCSRPQLGGLERRANFIAAMKAAGWPVVGVDLGDLLPVAGVVPEQVIMKYTTTINALREMGYIGVGAGRAEFTNGFYRVLAEFAEKKEQPPFTLAGNVGGLVGGKVTSRAEAFPGPGKMPMVGLTEVAQVGSTTIGVTSVIGPTVAKAVDALGAKTLVGFTAPKDSLDAAVKELAMNAMKPQLNILLYQGTLDEAKGLVKSGPYFPVIVCLSSDSEPPEMPQTANSAEGKQTLIVQIGYKGRYVGVLGAFKKSDGSYDLKYKLVPLGEMYVTPGDEMSARKTNPVLTLLDGYATQVKTQNLMGKFPQGPHPSQVQAPKSNLTFIGSDKCATCHAAEWDKWKTTKHAHALDSLEKTARRPSQRNFDGECVVCHTTGFGYKTGYRDDLTTTMLKHIGCESCHGPGSGHAAEPKDAKLLALQSPWRQNRTERLPDAATMESLAKLTLEQQDQKLTPVQKRTITAVSQACMACHDSENDPGFDLYTYWPKIDHAAKK
jgi:hypothetical protein